METQTLTHEVVPVAPPSRGEGRARLVGERKLIQAHAREYDRLFQKGGHIKAVRALVKAHPTEYTRLVKAAVARERNEGVDRAA